MEFPRPYSVVARLAAAVAAVITLAAVAPAVADAHSFLIRSTSSAGARLGSSPRSVTLYFSEPYVRSSERVTLRQVGGSKLKLTAPQGRGTVIHQPLPAKLRGVFVVSWQVLSDDGHISLGEFAFAVGSSAALPAVSARSGSTPFSAVAGSWLFFLGLALAAGGLVSERFVWRRRGETEVPHAPVLLGIAIAVIGALIELVLVAGGG